VITFSLVDADGVLTAAGLGDQDHAASLLARWGVRIFGANPHSGARYVQDVPLHRVAEGRPRGDVWRERFEEEMRGTADRESYGDVTLHGDIVDRMVRTVIAMSCCGPAQLTFARRRFARIWIVFVIAGGKITTPTRTTDRTSRPSTSWDDPCRAGEHRRRNENSR